MGHTFGAVLDNVERSLRRGDYMNARLMLIEGVQGMLAERYPFDVHPVDYGLAVVYNGYQLAAIGVVVHDLIRSSTKLEDLQKAEIGLVIARLREADCKTRILMVRNERIQGAVLRDLADRLAGVEVWNVLRLPELELPIRL